MAGEPVVEVDRARAIERAVELARPGRRGRHRRQGARARPGGRRRRHAVRRHRGSRRSAACAENDRMISLSLDEVRELAPGRLRVAPSATEVRGLQTDSRRVEHGDLFVAVGGGAEFVDDALARGAAAALVPGRRLRGAGRPRRPGARPELGTVRRDHRVDGQDVDEGHPRRDLRAPAPDDRRRAQLQRRDRRAADDRPRRARHRALHPRAGDARLRPDRRALRVRPARTSA